MSRALSLLFRSPVPKMDKVELRAYPITSFGRIKTFTLTHADANSAPRKRCKCRSQSFQGTEKVRPSRPRKDATASTPICHFTGRPGGRAGEDSRHEPGTRPTAWL